MKEKIITSLTFLTMFLTSCGRYQIKEEPMKNNNLFPEYEYNQEKVQGIYGQSKIAISDNGYYYIIDNILFFYNINSDVNMPLCSKVNCKHNDDFCDAYVSSINTANKGTFECNCLGEKVMFYNDHIYCIEVNKDRDYYLYQYDSSFNNRKQVAKLASVKDEQMMVSSAQACMITNGYLYYYASLLDSKYAKNDYIAPFYMCRIKLENNASREVLGEFQFPGDYAMQAGQGNGLAIYLSDNSVYFYAGGTARMYSANNNVQYRVAKYNPDSNQFTELWTYTGDETRDIFGDNTGYVNAMSNGEYVNMDSNGYFYIMTSTMPSGYNNMLIKVNFDKNTHEVIYTSQMEKLYSVKSDGEHLFFFESTQSKATKSYLTAIDIDGTLKCQYEMEYDEEYLAKMKSHYENFPDDNSVMPDARQINVYGFDERYILIGCPSSVNIYKNLKTTYTFNPKMSVTVGVGVINTMDYLNGNDASIKQIYQYVP